MLTLEEIKNIVNHYLEQFPDKEQRKILRTITESAGNSAKQKTFWVKEYGTEVSNIKYLVRKYRSDENAFAVSLGDMSSHEENPLSAYPVIPIVLEKALLDDSHAQTAIAHLIAQHPEETHYSQNAPFLFFKDNITHVVSLDKTIVRYQENRYFVLAAKNPVQGRHSKVKHILGFFCLTNGRLTVEDYPPFIAKINQDNNLASEIAILNKYNLLLKRALSPYAVVDGMGVVEGLPARNNPDCSKTIALIPTLGKLTFEEDREHENLQPALQDLFSILWHIAIFGEIGTHSDLYAHNIIRTVAGELEPIDYGLSVLLHQNTTSRISSPSKQVPFERLFGDTNPASDSYAFGVIFETVLYLNGFNQLHYHPNDGNRKNVSLYDTPFHNINTYFVSLRYLENREFTAYYQTPFSLTVRFIEDNLDKFFVNKNTLRERYEILRNHYIKALDDYYNLNLQLEKVKSPQEANNIKISLGQMRSIVTQFVKDLVAFVVVEILSKSDFEQSLSHAIKNHMNGLLSDLQDFLKKMTGNKDLICLYRDYANLYWIIEKMGWPDDNDISDILKKKSFILKSTYEESKGLSLRLTPQEGLFEFFMLLQKYCLPQEMRFFTLKMAQFLRVVSSIPTEYEKLFPPSESTATLELIVYSPSISDCPKVKYSLNQQTYLPVFFQSIRKKPLPSLEAPNLSEISGHVMRKGI